MLNLTSNQAKESNMNTHPSEWAKMFPCDIAEGKELYGYWWECGLIPPPGEGSPAQLGPPRHTRGRTSTHTRRERASMSPLQRWTAVHELEKHQQAVDPSWHGTLQTIKMN